MLEEDNRSPLGLFLQSLTVKPAIYSWRYDKNGTLIETNCPHHVLHAIFSHAGCLAEMLAHGQTQSEPLILSAQLGLVWCAVFDRKEDKLREALVIGPVFNTDSSEIHVSETIRNQEMEYSTRQNIIEAIRSVPVISSITFFHLCLMLHFCVTGERLSRSDIKQEASKADDHRRSHSRPNRQRTWQAERTLLQMVRDGDINYRSAMERAAQLSGGVRVRSSDPVLPAIVSSATFTGLCTRAAIDGGLTPDEAYTLGDSYVQNLLGCKTITEVRGVNHAMYEDFIQRVHRLRLNPAVSGTIQSVIDYVEMHLEDELTIDGIAAHFGYSRPYLSRRFKAESGSTLSEYIRFARIERAKKLLTGTDQSIHEIAEELHFASSSHFSDVFREVTGELPLAYRKRES